MFITKDESIILIHKYVDMSKRRHSIKNYEVTMPLIQTVCCRWRSDHNCATNPKPTTAQKL